MKAILSRVLGGDPYRLFLVDALGALLTVTLLAGVLATFVPVFGMPREVLYLLASIAAVFMVYSAVCYWLRPRDWRPFLRGIAVANLLYCCVTLFLVVYCWSMLTGWGITYFLGEIVLVTGLAVVELRRSLAA